MAIVYSEQNPHFCAFKFTLLKVFKSKQELIHQLDLLKEQGLTFGLVPTMGALHQGHLSLIEASKEKCNITIATIFLNPTQFNNPGDLIKYPQPIKEDIRLLEQAGCDILFNPSIDEMYSSGETWGYEVGEINEVLEGEFRPGHYQGVTQIVYKLFTLVRPDYAFFGQKDYQQFLVIDKMNADFDLGIKLIPCPIIRESDGLAMSSRNTRLNAEERALAIQLFQSLRFSQQNFAKMELGKLKLQILDFYKHPLLQLEYFEIVDPKTLHPLTEYQEEAIALIACTVGNTRLIDNMMLS